ncbi:VirB8/TrbF family protein [Sphingomonas sp. AR_OL41]|uniref:virB8 family protein n=1 Tax=Sphingomonas sp. AR_OL41 TaxID=3042729 RepID=UPI002480125F|nr:VirB8/TrbF family protein [Sphingomonas sp. AR_OL41]MDH7973007.1 VirB8/TrbF family protein [Sphingomonas sp. AR_OL41]
MKKEARESLDAYYREADSWATDQQDALRASRRIAWIIAAAAVVVAVFEAVALIFLAPLKTVVPYTLMVDRNTGYVQALKPLDANAIAPDAALTQSFLVQYVIARESFDINELQTSYRKVTVWSIDQARTDYVTSMQYANPGSPLARYPRTTTIATRIRSISPLGGKGALVRFETQRRDAGGQALPPRYWVAVIRYQFSTGPLSMEDRFLNPLGFQVVGYRRDAESAPAASDAEPPLATTTTAPGVVIPGAAPTPAPVATPIPRPTPVRPVRTTPEVQL